MQNTTSHTRDHMSCLERRASRRPWRVLVPLALQVTLVVPATTGVALATTPTKPAGQKNFFYFDQDYGSESQFGPLSVFVSVGFATVGRLNASARLRDIDLGEGIAHLKVAYGSPRRAIRDIYGSVGAWAFVEFVPIFGAMSAPNYGLHLVGEGMLTKKLEEYFEARGFTDTWARVAAISTVFLSQQMNEVVESQFVLPGDATADLIWNILGIAAFSTDFVSGLFSNDYVQLLYWPGQPVIDVTDSTLYNHAENYLLRTTLGPWTSWKLALAFGTGCNGAGVSIPIRGGTEFITLGAFLADTPLPGRDYQKPKPEPLFFWDHPTETFVRTKRDALPHEHIAVRAFWDRKGSLLATLDYSFPANYFGVNIYPGLVSAGPFGLGGYAAYSRGGGATVGLTVSAISLVPGFRF